MKEDDIIEDLRKVVQAAAIFVVNRSDEALESLRKELHNVGALDPS